MSTSKAPPWVNWNQSLHFLLEDEIGSELFEEYLEGQGVSVQLNFIYAVDGLKFTEEKSEESIRSLIRSILGLSQRLIGLSPSTRHNLKELFDDQSTKNVTPNLNIFDSAVQEVKSHMERTFYQQFFQSDIYLRHVEKYSNEKPSPPCSAIATALQETNALLSAKSSTRESVPDPDMMTMDTSHCPPETFSYPHHDQKDELQKVLLTRYKNPEVVPINVQLNEQGPGLDFALTLAGKLTKVAEDRARNQVTVQSMRDITTSLEADEILDAHVDKVFDDRTGDVDSPPHKERKESYRCRCRQCHHARHHSTRSLGHGVMETPYGSRSLGQTRALDLSLHSLDSGVYSGASVVSSGVGAPASQASSSRGSSKPGTSGTKTWRVLGNF